MVVVRVVQAVDVGAEGFQAGGAAHDQSPQLRAHGCSHVLLAQFALQQHPYIVVFCPGESMHRGSSGQAY